jgi:circadian clock protein KaiB
VCCLAIDRAEVTMAHYVLKLFITGQTPRSTYAIANLTRICRDTLHDQYEVLIIDVPEQPELAEEDKVLATPTLIKAFPPPVRRIIGDLSDAQKVIWGLGLKPSPD